MTTKAKTKQTAEEIESLAYCGPSIRGIAAQYQVFVGGIPAELAAAINDNPILGALVVPLAEMPNVRKSINAGVGKWPALFNNAKGVK